MSFTIGRQIETRLRLLPQGPARARGLLARGIGSDRLACTLSFGIASALVIMPTIAPEELNWVLTHIE